MVQLLAGELPHRVTIQARGEVSDGHRGFTHLWPPDGGTTVRARVPAKVEPLQGRDLERARQVDPRISHAVTLRYWRAYRADLAGGRTRLVYHPSSISADDRLLEIVGAPIDVEEAHVKVVVPCREVA